MGEAAHKHRFLQPEAFFGACPDVRLGLKPPRCRKLRLRCLVTPPAQREGLTASLEGPPCACGQCSGSSVSISFPVSLRSCWKGPAEPHPEAWLSFLVIRSFRDFFSLLYFARITSRRWSHLPWGSSPRDYGGRGRGAASEDLGLGEVGSACRSQHCSGKQSISSC